jgi:hypothetical protein
MRLRDLQARMMHFIRTGGTPPADLLSELKAPQSSLTDRVELYHALSRATQINALSAFYPVLRRLVGDALFEALAQDYLKARGSKSGNLYHLGQGFERVVVEEPACEDYPYLSEMARFEWAMHEITLAEKSHAAYTQTFLNPETVQAVWAEGLRVHSFAYPVHRIWEAHQDTEVSPVAMDGGEFHLALYRSEGGVQCWELEPEDVVLLSRGLKDPKLSDIFMESPHRVAETLARWRALGLLRGFLD